MVRLWLNKSVVLQLGDSILGLESKGQSPPNYLLTDAAFLIKSRNYKYDVSVFGFFRNSTFQERERTPARHIFCLWFSCFNTSWKTGSLRTHHSCGCLLFTLYGCYNLNLLPTLKIIKAA